MLKRQRLQRTPENAKKSRREGCLDQSRIPLTLLSPTSLEAVVQNPSWPLCLTCFLRSTGTIVRCPPTRPSAACDHGLGLGPWRTAHIDSEHTVLGRSSRLGLPTDCSCTTPPESDFPHSV
uniref:Uncharacterized protein n=1 Tax=Rousettus aegyptiacus TaxID=9407 RepID=A0A7J8DXI8_ROUAE|nr:hypothetical protein HJG63_008290 [Rousettus aegyptiacus]